MMGDNLNPHSTTGFNAGSPGTVMKVTSISMMITAIFIFVVIIFILFLCLHAHYTLGARATSRSRIRRRSHADPNFVFSTSDQIVGSGLDPAVLASLPVTIYQLSEFMQALECAVCLAELADGEKARLLPKCNHGFHLECIDTWLRANSTCPICRDPVDGEDGRQLTEPQHLDGERSTPRGERMPDISIPVRSTEMFQSPRSPLPSSRFEVEEMKTLIEESRSSETSEVVGDIEQGLMRSGEADGEGSSVVLKTPTGFEDAAVD